MFFDNIFIVLLNCV